MRWTGHLRRGLKWQMRGFVPLGRKAGAAPACPTTRDQVGVCWCGAEHISDPEGKGEDWVPKPEPLVMKVRNGDLTFSRKTG